MTLPSFLEQQLGAAGLDAAAVETLVSATLAEDLAGGVDVTSVAVIEPDDVAVADFVSRTRGVVAGVPIACAVLWVASGGTVELVRERRRRRAGRARHARVVGNRRDAFAAYCRTKRAEPVGAPLRYRDADASLGRRRCGQWRCDSRYQENDTGPAGAGEVRGAVRGRREPPDVAVRCGPDQGQPRGRSGWGRGRISRRACRLSATSRRSRMRHRRAG